MTIPQLTSDVIVSNGNPVRAFKKDGIYYGASEIVTLIPLSIYNIEKNKNKVINLKDYVGFDLSIYSLFVDLPFDDDEFLSGSNPNNLQYARVVLRVLKNEIVERKIQTYLSSNPSYINKLILPQDRQLVIRSDRDINSFSLYCEPVRLDPEIRIP